MQEMGAWERGPISTQSFERESVCVDRKDSSRIMEKVSSWMRGSLIGAGAFGKVNLALNRENGELFAVKSIECNERTGSEMQAMENEVQILQSLNSPFVVKCLGSSFSVEDGKSMRNVFIEHMSGGSVADLMKKFGGHFDEALIRNYTRSILEGIHYLHSQDIVHCDIKGKNVLVGSSGVKLADFGGARRVVGDGAMIVDSHLLNVKGTPLWMAPEVVRQVEQGPASDIWSLGCTVVEMATGKAPWSDIASAANPFVALYHIGCTEEVPDLPSCLSEQGQDFLSKCFQRDPRVRWTAAQLLHHSFITENFPAIQQPSKSASAQPSPTSAFDFPSSSATSTLTSSIANSVPILRSPLFAKRLPQHQQAANFFQTEEAPVRSDERATSSPSSSSSGTDFWCNSPLSPLPGQWIVVRSPKTTSPASSPTTTSAAARELAPITCRAEKESAVSVSQGCEDLPLEVEEEKTPAVASSSSCLPVGEDVGMAEDEDQREWQGMATEESLRSRAKQSFWCSSSSSNKEKAHDDDTVPGETGEQGRQFSGRGASSSSCSSPTRAGAKKSWRNQTDNGDSEHCYCSGGGAAADDTRCIDTRERPPKLKYASTKATLRKLASAHRKLFSRGSLRSGLLSRHGRRII